MEYCDPFSLRSRSLYDIIHRCDDRVTGELLKGLCWWINLNAIARTAWGSNNIPVALSLSPKWFQY